MPFPLGPILAQVVSLAVGDRTEGRFIAAPAHHYEASTGPTIGLRSDWRHMTLSVGYGAGIVLTPLESEPRALSVFNTAYIGLSYKWRRTVLTVGQTVGYGSVNFATQALAGAGGQNGVPVTAGAGAANGNAGPSTPAPLPIGTVVGAGGAPVGAGPPGSTVTPNQARALNRLVLFGSTATSVGVTQTVTPTLRVGAEVGYAVGGALREKDREDYPTVRGPRFGLSLGYRLDPRNDLSSTLAAQYSVSSRGTSAWLGSFGENWGHRFDRRTSGNLSAGIALTRSPSGNGFVAYSVFPTLAAGLSTALPLNRGVLSLSCNAASAPVLDPIAQAVDPRVAFGVGAGWSRNRFFSSLSASSALSIDKKSDAGALRAVAAAAGVGYRLGDAVSADTGVRAAYQLYQGQDVIPLTYGAFVGLTIGAGTTFK